MTIKDTQDIEEQSRGWGIDKRNRAGIVLYFARTCPIKTLELIGRVVQVSFKERFDSDKQYDPENILFYQVCHARSYHDHLRKLNTYYFPDNEF